MPKADKQEAAPAATPKIRIKAAHGLMVHPYMPATFNQDAITEVDELDSWLDSQIEAGKLLVV